MRVQIEYEIQGFEEETLLDFWKEIDMPAAPTETLTFVDGDYQFEPHSVVYNIDDQSYFVYSRMYNVDAAEAKKYEAMFTRLGWEQRKAQQ